MYRFQYFKKAKFLKNAKINNLQNILELLKNRLK